MAIPLAAPEESGLIENRAQRRRNPKGKKARKAAARLAVAREAQVLMPAAVAAPQKPRKAKPAKKGKAKAKAKAQPPVVIPKAVRPEQLPAIPERRPWQAPIATLPQPAARPVQPEPLIMQEPRSVSTHSAGPESVAPPALRLLAEPEPLVEAPVAPEEPAAEFANALAAEPLPRARALVPARRQGLVDAIAFLLRDSGRRLARWSARRHKSREEQAALRLAEARQINLQRELEALEVLRRNKG